MGFRYYLRIFNARVGWAFHKSNRYLVPENSKRGITQGAASDSFDAHGRSSSNGPFFGGGFVFPPSGSPVQFYMESNIYMLNSDRADILEFLLGLRYDFGGGN